MENLKKIGFLEKYNKEAQVIEKSSMNLQMFLSLLAALVYAYMGSFSDSKPDTTTFITVLFALLIYSVSPKLIAKMAKKE